MRKRTLVTLASLLGLASLAIGSKTYQEHKDMERYQEAITAVRELFGSMGSIATVYVDQTRSDKFRVRGGVVMVDGPVYAFDYLAGEIFYEEALDA